MNNVKRTTIVFPVRRDQVLLGMKKRGFGEGWWNGFGGKLEGSETYEENARRETLEEVGLKTGKLNLTGRILFYIENNLSVISSVFVCSDFSGIPFETDEMRPRWFSLRKLPYKTMWEGDRHWIPRILEVANSQNPLGFAVVFDSNGKFKSISDADKDIIKEFFKI